MSLALFRIRHLYVHVTRPARKDDLNLTPLTYESKWQRFSSIEFMIDTSFKNPIVFNDAFGLGNLTSHADSAMMSPEVFLCVETDEILRSGLQRINPENRS